MEFINLLKSDKEKNFNYVLSLRDVGDNNLYECIRMSALEFVNEKGEPEVNHDILEVKVKSGSTWDIFFFNGKTLCLMEPDGYKINSEDKKLHALYRELLREENLKTTMFILGVFRGYFFNELEHAAKTTQ